MPFEEEETFTIELGDLIEKYSSFQNYTVSWDVEKARATVEISEIHEQFYIVPQEIESLQSYISKYTKKKCIVQTIQKKDKFVNYFKMLIY